MASAEPHLYRSTDFGKHWTQRLRQPAQRSRQRRPHRPQRRQHRLHRTRRRHLRHHRHHHLPHRQLLEPARHRHFPTHPSSPSTPPRKCSPATAAAACSAPPPTAAASGKRLSSPRHRLAQPALTLSANSFNFPDTSRSARESAPQTLTITSSGNAPSPSAPSRSPETSPSPAHRHLQRPDPRHSTRQCTVQHRLRSQRHRHAPGQLTLYGNIPGSPRRLVALTGNGQPTPQLSCSTHLTRLTFAATVVNQTTAAQIVTVSNTGGVPSATLQTPIHHRRLRRSPPTPAAPRSPPNTGCSVSITFTPTASGTRSGTLTVTDDSRWHPGRQPHRHRRGARHGHALARQRSPSLTQQIGTTSAAQQVTLTNAGDVRPHRRSQVSVSSRRLHRGQRLRHLAGRAHHLRPLRQLHSPSASGTHAPPRSPSPTSSVPRPSPSPAQAAAPAGVSLSTHLPQLRTPPE